MSDQVNDPLTPVTTVFESEEALFAAALDKSESQRIALLDQACGGNAALRRRIEVLLAADARPDLRLTIPEDDALIRARSARFNTDPHNSVGQTIGRYALLERLGEGGWGVVYVAEQREPVRRHVALKVIKPGMDTRLVVARFEVERQALAMMDHPNIARVLDAGATETGRPYFVMELVRGIRITDFCDQQRLSTLERLDLFIKICQAIQHAHQKGIIHRDIKPSNILVSLQDGIPVPKVIDFGIVKAVEGRLGDATIYTQAHHFIGTPAYMSPEQAELGGMDIDTRSDIYSLGVLLYELLTGKTPFDPAALTAAGLDAARRTIREKEPVRPSTRLYTSEVQELTEIARRRSTEPPKLVHLVRGDLDWIVMKCLEKDRSRRYETANGLAADLKRHLANEPVIARPPSPGYRLRKAFRRNRLVFSASAIVALILLLATGVSTWQVLKTRKAQQAEIEQRLTAQAAQKRAETAQAAEAQERMRADAERTTAQRHLYAANMNLAQQAWEQPEFGRLQQLLDETQDSPFRGFEWFYWEQQSHLALKTLRGHLATVNVAAFSPDGETIVTGSEDFTAVLWESATGRPRSTFQKHTGTIWSIAVSPDSQRVLSGAGDQTARVWELASGREVLLLKGHPYRVYGVAFSPDGQRLATRNGASTVTVREAASGQELLTLGGHTGSVYSVNFSHDGHRLVTSSRDRTAKVWDAGTGRELLTLNGHSASVSSASFSTDDQRIVTSSEDQTAKVWDATTGHELFTLKGHNGPVWSVAMSPDGQYIVTGSEDQLVKLWAAATGRELRTLRGHGGPIRSVAFSPDSRRILTACNDRTAKIWDASLDGQGLVFRGHSNQIWGLAFSPDGRRLVTTSPDLTARIWDPLTGQELVTFREHTGRVTAAAFSPDGQRVVTVSKDQTAKIWEASTGRLLRTLQGHQDELLAVAFSPDGQRIVTGCDDQTARVWDANSGRELITFRGHPVRLTSVAFSPDGQRIVSAGGEETARVWDANTGKELLALTGHSEGLLSAEFSKDGQRIVTGGMDRTAKVWDAATGKELLTLTGHSEPIASVAFSPDGQRVLTGSHDHTAKIWETVTGRDLLTLKGHSGRIFCVAFSPDGHRVVTGSADQTARVWLAALPEQIVAWQHEEREAKDSLADLQRERKAEEQRRRLANAADEGVIKRWRILAPIPLSPGQSREEALTIEQVPGEARLQPRAGEAQAFGNVELRWRDVLLPDEVLAFKSILGRMTVPNVAYAVCYVWAETEMAHVRMLVGCSDEAAVYLNGKQVHKWLYSRGYGRERNMVPDLSLVPGPNRVVFKIVNGASDWKASLQFTDDQGHPLLGIRTMLDPDAKPALRVN